MLVVPFNPKSPKFSNADDYADKQKLITKLKKTSPEIFNSEGKIKGKLCMFKGLKFLVLP